MSKTYHKSVLVREILNFLQVKKSGKYIDATIGGGGIAREILKRGGRVLGIEWDEDAIKFLEKEFAKEIEEKRLILERENFVRINEIARKHRFENCAGIIFDLGISEYQLKSSKRGFSFLLEGPLDMRMDERLAVTAKDLLAALPEKELSKLFAKFSEEKAAVVAKEIVAMGKKTPITTTKQLTNLVGKITKPGKIHPATKVFLALRSAVNFELENLRAALPAAVSILGKAGRLLVVSFHSAEDTIVKDFFKNRPDLAILTGKPVRPTQSEILVNPASRSAKLRATKRLV